MALRNILTVEEPVLHKTARPVTRFDAHLGELLDDMRQTLTNAGGVGLAAPQIGILRRVVVVDDDGELIELVNPEILETSGEQDGMEGCLSVPATVWSSVRNLCVCARRTATATGSRRRARA